MILVPCFACSQWRSLDKEQLKYESLPGHRTLQSARTFEDAWMFFHNDHAQIVQQGQAMRLAQLRFGTCGHAMLLLRLRPLNWLIRCEQYTLQWAAVCCKLTCGTVPVEPIQVLPTREFCAYFCDWAVEWTYAAKVCMTLRNCHFSQTLRAGFLLD